MHGRLRGDLASALRQAFPLPLRDRSFWAVQAAVVVLAAAHLCFDLVAWPKHSFITDTVPVAVLLIPVSYAALRYGLSGSAATAVWATVLTLPDLFTSNIPGHVGNDLIELAVVVAMAIFVGLRIDSEHAQRDRARRSARLLLRAQEEERRRIAREIHDEPLQLLVHLSRHLERLEQTTGRGDPESGIAAELGRARRETHDITERLRLLLGGLRPPALDKFGLVAALRGLLVRAEEGLDGRAELVVRGEETRMPPEVELGAFRITQEAVNNVVRHAGAHRLGVTLSFGPEVFAVEVVDDGHGFDPAEVRMRPEGARLGTMGMHERAEILGGTLEIDSKQGRGTTVRSVLPLA